MNNRVLVYGGSGALGRSVVQLFKSKGYSVINVDIVENTDADFNAMPTMSAPLSEQGRNLHATLSKYLGTNKLNGIFCVAGGWTDFLNSSELMLQQSLHSSLIAANLASTYLQPGGLLTLTGALAALDATPGAIGYGIAKAAVHHLTKDLSAPNGGLPEGSKVLAILPVTIDTPMNRKFMPKADFGSWTSPVDIAKQLEGYLSGTLKVTSGSLIGITTSGGKTQFNVLS
ncbi:hypothetical protein BDB01DRAFT_714097 [Pilobolus umbonatus]|nr:hypothetical protein BDB01DRAFT_714097 [Pilobolus umbonatus]